MAAGLIDTSELIPHERAQGIPDNYETEHASPDAFGASIGQGLEKAGNEAASTAGFYGKVSADYAYNNLADGANKILYGDPTQKGADGSPDHGFFGLQGQAASDAWPTVKQKLSDLAAQQRKSLSSPDSLLDFDMNSRRLLNYTSNSIGQHANQQFNVYASATNAATGNITLNAIGSNPNDQGWVDLNTNKMVDAAQKEAHLKGATGPDDPISVNLVQKARQDALKAQVLAMSATPEGASRAQTLLESKKDVAGDLYPVLEQHVKTQASQYQVDQGVADAVHQASGEVNSGIAPKGISAHGGPYITGADGKTYATDGDGNVVQPASAQGSAAAPAAKAGPASYPAMGAGTAHAQQGGSMAWEGMKAPPAGYGAIDSPYNRPLDAKGPSGLSAADSFQFLKSHGASTNEALVLTGAAANESGFNSGAWHDNRTGYGMFGHKMDRLNLVGLSPQQQMLEALNELRHRPEAAMVNAAKSPQDLAMAEMHYEQPQGYSNASPQNGHNFTGRLKTLQYFSQMANGQFTGANGSPIAGRVVAGPGGKMVGTEGLSGMDMLWTPQALASQPEQPQTVTPSIQNGAETPAVSAPSQAPAANPAPQPASYAVMDTSPAGMSQMSGAVGAMNVAARAMQIWGARTDITPEQREAGFTKLKQNLTQAQFAAESSQQEIKQQSNAQAKSYVPRIVGGDASVIGQIANDPKLDFSTQKELLTMARENGIQGAAGMGPSYNDALKRLVLPNGDPNRISNYTQLLQMRNNGELSDQGLAKVGGDMEKVKQQDFQGVVTAKAAVLDQVKNYMTYGEEGNSPGALKDPKGKEANDKFVVAFEADFDARIAKGENPFDILKDQKGIKALSDSIRSPEQKRIDQIQESAGNEAAAYNPAAEQAAPPPAPEKVNPDTWSQVIEARPTMQTNQGPQKLRRDAWGSFLTSLLSKPADVQQTVLKSFAQRFPGSDLEAPFARLLSEQQGAKEEPPARPVTPTPPELANPGVGFIGP